MVENQRRSTGTLVWHLGLEAYSMSERIEGVTRALGMALLEVDRLVAGPSRNLSSPQSSRSELSLGGRLE